MRAAAAAAKDAAKVEAEEISEFRRIRTCFPPGDKDIPIEDFSALKDYEVDSLLSSIPSFRDKGRLRRIWSSHNQVHVNADSFPSPTQAVALKEEPESLSSEQRTTKNNTTYIGAATKQYLALGDLPVHSDEILCRAESLGTGSVEPNASSAISSVVKGVLVIAEYEQPAQPPQQPPQQPLERGQLRAPSEAAIHSTVSFIENEPRLSPASRDTELETQSFTFTFDLAHIESDEDIAEYLHNAFDYITAAGLTEESSDLVTSLLCLLRYQPTFRVGIIRVLVEICTFPNGKYLLRELGTVSALLSVLTDKWAAVDDYSACKWTSMYKEQADPKRQPVCHDGKTAAVVLLRALASHSAATKATIVNSGGITALVSLLIDGTSSGKKHAAGLLALLAQSSSDYAEQMMAAGAVPALVNLLSHTSPDRQEVQEAVVSVLFVLSTQKRVDMAATLISSGALAAMMTFADSAREQVGRAGVRAEMVTAAILAHTTGAIRLLVNSLPPSLPLVNEIIVVLVGVITNGTVAYEPTSSVGASHSPFSPSPPPPPPPSHSPQHHHRYHPASNAEQLQLSRLYAIAASRAVAALYQLSSRSENRVLITEAGVIRSLIKLLELDHEQKSPRHVHLPHVMVPPSQSPSPPSPPPFVPQHYSSRPQVGSGPTHTGGGSIHVDSDTLCFDPLTSTVCSTAALNREEGEEGLGETMEVEGEDYDIAVHVTRLLWSLSARPASAREIVKYCGIPALVLQLQDGATAVAKEAAAGTLLYLVEGNDVNSGINAGSNAAGASDNGAASGGNGIGGILRQLWGEGIQSRDPRNSNVSRSVGYTIPATSTTTTAAAAAATTDSVWRKHNRSTIVRLNGVRVLTSLWNRAENRALPSTPTIPISNTLSDEFRPSGLQETELSAAKTFALLILRHIASNPDNSGHVREAIPLLVSLIRVTSDKLMGSDSTGRVLTGLSDDAVMMTVVTVEHSLIAARVLCNLCYGAENRLVVASEGAVPSLVRLRCCARLLATQLPLSVSGEEAEKLLDDALHNLSFCADAKTMIDYWLSKTLNTLYPDNPNLV